ncbi:hypothetical protein [Oleiharenicola lentus]|uniref:hypothetical protein n=1 Tax=Oleiharenicola lentus TaxID=2508720 RepID=UPI003F665AF9
MQMLPALFPDKFPSSSLSAENTSALWIRFMGLVNVTFGTLFILNLQVLPFLVRVLAWRPQAIPQVVRASQAARAAAARMPATILRPALRLEAKVAARRAQPQPVPVRVDQAAA